MESLSVRDTNHMPPGVGVGAEVVDGPGMEAAVASLIEEWDTSLPRARGTAHPRLAIDPENVERGLLGLVLTLVEFLRQLLERQAVARMEGGGLTDEQVEQVGLALMRLADKMEELKEQFGFEDSDLNLDLGPLGRLV